MTNRIYEVRFEEHRSEYTAYIYCGGQLLAEGHSTMDPSTAAQRGFDVIEKRANAVQGQTR
jgi:hypothetical protein